MTMSESDTDKADELIQRAKETKRELDAQQNEILDSISEEYSGAVIEEEVDITPDHTATVSTNLSGRLIRKISRIDTVVSEIEEGNDVEAFDRTMRDVAGLLEDLIAEPEYDADLFLEVYENSGAVALGEIASRVIGVIDEEADAMQGGLDGFRQE